FPRSAPIPIVPLGGDDGTDFLEEKWQPDLIDAAPTTPPNYETWKQKGVAWTKRSRFLEHSQRQSGRTQPGDRSTCNGPNFTFHFPPAPTTDRPARCGCTLGRGRRAGPTAD